MVKRIIHAFLFFVIGIFLVFGSYQIDKSETTDEHFWKYDRIPQYWSALHDGNLKKTAVNDKPGITVAFLSGVGMLFGPDPLTHRIRNDIFTSNKLYTLYDTTITSALNLSLRLPLLFFNAAFLLYFFWIFKKITRNEWVALWATLFIGTSPILIGISRIINPDALLWSFGSAALFTYIALLYDRQKKYVILTAFFTGLALLSKYTSNILFPIYFLLIFLHYIITQKTVDSFSSDETRAYFTQNLKDFGLIFIGSAVTFSVFMPAVFVKPILLYRATLGFPLLLGTLPVILTFIAILFFDHKHKASAYTHTITAWLHTHEVRALRILSGLAFLFFGFIVLNGFFHNIFIPFDTLLETAKGDGKLAFPTLKNTFPPYAFIQKILLQAYPFTFSLTPIVLLSSLYFWFRTFRKPPRSNHILFIIITIIPFVYFIAALMGHVLTNTRYAILLYPLIALFVAIGIRYCFPNLSTKHPLAITVTLLVFAILSLVRIEPFYFNYTNAFLPREFSVHDGWGYGSYEAAEYLNSLPQAENLVIWSDRNLACQFFVGKCLTGAKIDTSTRIPDYLIISKRGVERGYSIVWKGDLTKVPHPKEYYYTGEVFNNPAWQIFIDNRPDNFIKVIKVQQ